MTTEEIKLAAIQLLEAQKRLKETQQAVVDAQQNLVEMFRAEGTILEKWNTIEIDGSYWDLKFDTAGMAGLGEFESLKPNYSKHL